MNAPWFQRLMRRRENQPSFVSPPNSPSPKLQEVLPSYEQALLTLDVCHPDTLLATLLARDQVEAVRKQDSMPPVQTVQQLIRLDEQLRQKVTPLLLPSLVSWRKSLCPPQSHWWWYLDEVAATKETDKDFLWQILAITLFVLTIPLATDIIRRLWAHAPDNIAIVSTLLTLLITASPFTQNGRALVTWLLRRFPRLPTHRHAEAMATTAFIAFLLIAGVRFLYLPQLAERYNDQGVAAIEQGQLTVARQKLQQAIAINSDLAPSYYNLAAAYETIARYDEAIRWYEQALDHDLDLAPAYNNLGRLYLLQGKPDKAQTVLSSGLAVLQNATMPDTAVNQQTNLLTLYLLHTNLGQAYYEQEQFAQAAEQLSAALVLETNGELDPSFFAARPHYYLALTYEALQRPSADIIAQWEAALSYLTADDPAAWQTTIAEHLSAWR